jgi:CysZ protein
MEDRQVVPRIPSSPGPGDFLRGFVLPLKAAGLIFRSRTLLTLSTISGAITFVTLSAWIVVLSLYTDDLLGRLWPRPELWYALIGWYAAAVLGFLLLLVVGANTLPLLLQAPLQDPLSEATEELCGGFEGAKFSPSALARGVAVSLAHTSRRIAALVAGHAVLFVFNFIPGLGSIVWTVLAAAWTMYWAAGEYLGAPMARHLYPFAAVRAALRKRTALCFGFGAAVYFLLWVPVLNFFFIPVATVGGTLLFRALRATGDVPAIK